MSPGRSPPPTTAGARALGVVGGAVVAGSFQGHDQASLRAALAELGAGFVGVADLPADATDAQVRNLHAAGVRAVRINLRRGGRRALDGLQRRARRVWALVGWHVELYVAGADLPELEPRLARLPRIVIDHLDLTATGQDALLRLVDGGARVKATGFGRVDLHVPATPRAIHAADPHALLAGTDLPSTRARRPFADADLELIVDTLGTNAAPAVLRDNARALYGLA